MVQIIPAILATTEEEYKEKLQKIEELGLFEGGWVHIDVMDNKFVQNKSVDAEAINKYKTTLKKEIHLMVEDPAVWVDQLNDVDRFTAHIEVGEDRFNEFKKRCLREGIEVGIALKLETSLDVVEQHNDLNRVMLMGVNPGQQGQEFNVEVIERVKELKNSPYKGKTIGVDGGVSPENAKQLVEAGADYLVVGSHLVEGNIEENLEEFWTVLATQGN